MAHGVRQADPTGAASIAAVYSVVEHLGTRPGRVLGHVHDVEPLRHREGTASSVDAEQLLPGPIPPRTGGWASSRRTRRPRCAGPRPATAPRSARCRPAPCGRRSWRDRQALLGDLAGQVQARLAGARARAREARCPPLDAQLRPCGAGARSCGSIGGSMTEGFCRPSRSVSSSSSTRTAPRRRSRPAAGSSRRSGRCRAPRPPRYRVLRPPNDRVSLVLADGALDRRVVSDVQPPRRPAASTSSPTASPADRLSSSHGPFAHDAVGQAAPPHDGAAARC